MELPQAWQAKIIDGIGRRRGDVSDYIFESADELEKQKAQRRALIVEHEISEQAVERLELLDDEEQDKILKAITLTTPDPSDFVFKEALTMLTSKYDLNSAASRKLHALNSVQQDKVFRKLHSGSFADPSTHVVQEARYL